MIEALIVLILLVMLQAVLGFDNLLYISLESRRAPKADQSRVRKLGIGIAVGLRIVLLFVLIQLVSHLQNPWFSFPKGGWVEGTFNFHSVIVLFGGVFILYTAVKEILHMMSLEEDGHLQEREESSSGKVIFKIVLMNVIFSFDSILSAMALASIKDASGMTVGYQLPVMVLAILIGGVLMIVLADKVSTFLQKNRMYEVLGLFVLFVVGIMLLTEGGHLAHLAFFGNEIHAMTKTTFYFVIGVLILTDLVQGRYQKKLNRAKIARLGGGDLNAEH
ncbi:MAG: TerC family protein [Verrucomicrobiaceae bacterium]